MQSEKRADLEICSNFGGVCSPVQSWQPSVSHAVNRRCSQHHVGDLGLEQLEIESEHGKSCTICKYTVIIAFLFSFRLEWSLIMALKPPQPLPRTKDLSWHWFLGGKVFCIVWFGKDVSKTLTGSYEIAQGGSQESLQCLWGGSFWGKVFAFLPFQDTPCHSWLHLSILLYKGPSTPTPFWFHPHSLALSWAGMYITSV